MSDWQAEEYREGLTRVARAVDDASRRSSSSRRQRLQQQVVALTDELAKIAERPDEPDGYNAVVRFTKRFRGNRTRYHYVAIRSGDGRWYVSGANQLSNPYNWDALLDFIESAGGSLDNLVIATAWQRLTTVTESTDVDVTSGEVDANE